MLKDPPPLRAGTWSSSLSYKITQFKAGMGEIQWPLVAGTYKGNLHCDSCVHTTMEGTVVVSTVPSSTTVIAGNVQSHLFAKGEVGAMCLPVFTTDGLQEIRNHRRLHQHRDDQRQHRWDYGFTRHHFHPSRFRWDLHLLHGKLRWLSCNAQDTRSTRGWWNKLQNTEKKK